MCNSLKGSLFVPRHSSLPPPLAYLSPKLSFSLLPKDSQTSTSMSFIELTGLDLMPRFAVSTQLPPADPRFKFWTVFVRLCLNYVLFFAAGSRDVLLRRTDEMERPQPDRKFQCVDTLLALITHTLLRVTSCWRTDVTAINKIPLFHSFIFKRSIQQVPVLQHAGFPPEGHSAESESAPVCHRQSGLPTAVGVSLLPTKTKLNLLIISELLLD